MSAQDDIEDSSAPLMEHLTELRSRLIYSVMAFLVGMIISFIFAGMLLDYLLVPIEKTMRNLGNPNPVMQYTAPQEYFFTLIRISVVGGLMLSFPVIAFQLWRFVAPGLYRNEKNAFLPFLIASPVLFLLGAAFAQYIVVPLAMAFFLGFAAILCFRHHGRCSPATTTGRRGLGRGNWRSDLAQCCTRCHRQRYRYRL